MAKKPDTKAARVPLDSVEDFDRYLLAALKAAGLTYLDEIQSLPVGDLCKIVKGPKGQQKLFRYLNREAEWTRHTGRYEIDLGEKGHIKGSDINQAMSLRGTARYFLGGIAEASDLRKAVDEGRVTREQIGAYLLANRNAKQQLAQPVPQAQREEQATVQVQVSSEELDAQIDKLVRQYREEYDVTRWNRSDWDMVRRLAMLEIFAETQQRALLARGPDAIFAFGPQVKAVSDQINAALSQIRQMRDEMEISLKARAAKDVRSEAYEVIADFALQAKRLIAERSSILIHCGIRIGLCLPYFPRDVLTRQVQVRCPECGKILVWDIVTQEMLDTYVEAGDFVPKGAPAGAFDRPEGELGESGTVDFRTTDEFTGIEVNHH